MHKLTDILVYKQDLGHWLIKTWTKGDDSSYFPSISRHPSRITQLPYLSRQNRMLATFAKGRFLCRIWKISIGHQPASKIFSKNVMSLGYGVELGRLLRTEPPNSPYMSHGKALPKDNPRHKTFKNCVAKVESVIKHMIQDPFSRTFLIPINLSNVP
jgi:hypothetical protein